MTFSPVINRPNVDFDEAKLEKPDLAQFIGRGSSRLSGRAIWVVYLIALAIFLLQAPGHLVFDTKLDLVINPGGLLKSLSHLWDGSRYQGTLQDQYIGYAWPMGPFFALGSLLDIPMWIVQRAWEAMVFTVALYGMVRLLEALDFGTFGSRAFSALAFALWPTFTMLIGSTSYAILPGALLPLAVVPLVNGMKGGSPQKAGLLSALVILCMGGVNATSTLDNMLVPVIFLLTRERNKRLYSITKWWILGLILAISWWLLPLIFLGGYGFNFLPFVEQAKTTTSTMAATEVLRGAGNWTAYLDFGFLKGTDITVLAGGGNPNPTLDFQHPWIQGGWVMATFPLAIISSAVVAALALCGMARRDLPEKAFLRITLMLGSVGAMAGYWGHLGGPLSSEIQTILNGALAPLRNIYKLEPAIAVVMVIALCHVGPATAQWVKDSWRFHNLLSSKSFLYGCCAILFASLATPYLTGRVLNSGSFPSIPIYWQNVATFLKTYSPNSPALMVPASSQGMYVWGTTVDEPLESLATSPWTTLDQVPYGGAGNRRFLDAIEYVFESGNVPNGMTTYLTRAGITYLIVRNDVDWQASESPSPAKVHSVLSQMNYVSVANFGPLIPSQDYLTTSTNGSAPLIPPKYPAVQIYAPQSLIGKILPQYPVTTMPTSKTVLVSGGPGSLMQLTSQGLVSDQPVILSGNSIPSSINVTPNWISTDTLRRQQVDFGLLNQNTSYTLTQDEPAPLGSPGGEGGKTPNQILPFPPSNHQTVAVLPGVESLTASSYGSWFFTLPEDGPFAAFDGDPNTAWVEGSVKGPVGQWIQATFKEDREIPSITVEMLDDNDKLRPVATSLTVTTSSGSVTTPIRNTNLPQQLNVAPGPTSFARITISGAVGGEIGGPGVGIREIGIPGVLIQRFLAVPSDVSPGSFTSQSFSFSTNAQSANVTSGAAYPQLARIFTVDNNTNFNINAQALPVPSSSLNTLIAPKGDLQIFSNSTYGNLPRFSVTNLLTSTHTSAWIAGNPNPQIVISWQGKKTISTIHFTYTTNFAARPLSISLTSLNGDRQAKIDSNGNATFAPLTTNAITLNFPSVQKIVAVNQLTGEIGQLPVGLSGISIKGLDSLKPKQTPLNSKVTIPCGQGPPISIDSTVYTTSVTGTYQNLVLAEPMAVNICGTTSVNLSQGSHAIVAEPSNSPFSISSVTLTPPGTSLNTTSITLIAQSRPISVIHWGNDTRTLSVSQGTQSYLEIHENFNNGWHATLNGLPLTSVVLDGWQQGFVIPAGQGGVITINYVPNFLYQLGLVAGGLAALGLLIAALIAVFGNWKRDEDLEETKSLNEPPNWLWWTLLGVAIFLISGPMVIAVPVLAYISKRWITSNYLSWIAFISMALAGLIDALSPGLNAQGGVGSFGYLSQALAIIALTCALVPAYAWWRPLERLKLSNRTPDEGKQFDQESQTVVDS